MTTDPTLQCIPVRTVLKLKYKGADEKAEVVQAFVKELLERDMIDRTDQLFVGDVIALHYVGTHDFSALYQEPGNTNTEEAKPQKQIDEDDTDVPLAASVISATSAIVLLLFLLFVRRRRRPDETKESMPIDNIQKNLCAPLKDLEQGDNHPLHVPTMSSMEIEDRFSPTTSNESMEDLSPSSMKSASSDEGHAPQELDLMIDNDIASIFRSKQEPEEATPTDTQFSSSAPLLLPPRPPRRETIARQIPSGKITTTRRRRRKKKSKKKTETLQRTSSREHIQAMEAIPEIFYDDSSSDDEHDNGDDDYSSAEGEDDPSSGYSTPLGDGSESGSTNTRSRFPSDPDSSDVQRILDSIHYQFGVIEDQHDGASSRPRIMPWKESPP